MPYSPPPRYPLASMVITPWSKESYANFLNTPGSNTWPVANKALFMPIRLLEPFVVQKVGWGMAATASNNADVGVYEMTDLSAGRMDMIRSIGATAITVANAVQDNGTWRVARTSLLSANNNADQTSYTTASVTLKTGRLYLLTVVNVGTLPSGSADPINSITGGPTWTSRATVQYDSSNHSRISVWSGVPTVDYTGTLVIDYNSLTQIGAEWALTEMSGVDTSTNDGIVQSATNSGTSTNCTVTLSSFASANNATFGAMGTATNQGFTPGTGFTELTDLTMTSPNQGMTTIWRVDNSTTVNATAATSSVGFGAIGLEIKADASSFLLPASANLYIAMSCDATAPTVAMAAPSVGTVVRESGNLELTTTFPLPSTCTPVAATGTRIPLVGISRRTLLG